MRLVVLALAGALLRAQEPAAPDPNALMAEARLQIGRGDAAAAKTTLERVWMELEKGPPEDPRRYDTLKMQSAVATLLGQYEEAEQYIQIGIAWRQTVIGRNDPKLADEYVEIAMLCYRKKDFDRGLELLKQALNRVARANSFDSVPVADIFSRMALMHLGQSKQEDAAFDLDTAVQIRAKVLGADHPALLPDLDRLGTTRISLRHYDKAEQVYRRALSIRERMLAPTDPDLIPSVEGLGYAFFGQKKYPEAESQYQRLLRLWEGSAGSEHPMVAQTLEKIAILYREQKRWDDSRPLAERALAIRALFQARGLNQEASARYLHGDRKEGEELYKRALALLDPARAEHKELHATIIGILREIDAAPPPPAPPARRTKK